MSRAVLDEIAEVTNAKSKTGTLDMSIAEQCFLMSNIKTIALNLSSGAGGASSVSGGGLTQRNFFNSATGGDLKGFLGVNAENPAVLISRLKKTSKQSNIEKLLAMNNLQIAGLSPKIKLYKIVRDIDRNPIVEGLIPFSNNSKSSIFTSVQGRGDDVQIESVSFDFKNQNPFGAGRLVDVRMVIIMKNGYSLTEPRFLDSVKNLGAGGTGATVEDALKIFKFSDLFLRDTTISASSYDGLDYQIRANIGWEHEGHGSVRESGLKSAGFGPNEKEVLESQEVSLILELANYDVNFRQDGKFAVTLEYVSHIEVEADDASTDIFRSPLGPGSEAKKDSELYKLMEEQREIEIQLNALKLQEQAARDALKELGRKMDQSNEMGGSDGPSKASMSAFKEGKARYESVIKAKSAQETALRASRDRVRRLASALTVSARSRDKVIMYSKLLEDIFEHRRVYSFSIDRSDLIFFSPEFEKELLGNRPDLADFALTELQSVSQNTIDNGFYEAISPGGIDYSEQINRHLQAVIGGDSPNVAGATPAQFSEAIRRMEQESLTFSASTLSSAVRPPSTTGGSSGPGGSTGPIRTNADVIDPSKHEVYWFYYGDLVRAALNINNTIDAMREKRMGIVLGTIGYNEERGRFGYSSADKTEEVLINLAHVPITLEKFYSFMKKNVLDKNKTRYTIMEFMKDTLNQLVIPTINTRCFGRGLANPVKIKSTFIEGYMNDTDIASGRDPLLNRLAGSGPMPGLSSTSPGSHSFTDELDFVDDIISYEEQMRRSSVDRRYTYLFCYGHSKDKSIGEQYTGSRSADHFEGIWHIDLRSNRGLVKDVLFTKRAIKYLSESTIFEQSQASDGINPKLWNVFDVEIEMVGNNLFKPGSHLYISTSSSGLGSAEDPGSTASLMGLGGYYLVTSVSNNLVNSGAGNWSTRVKAIWQTSGNKRSYGLGPGGSYIFDTLYGAS